MQLTHRILSLAEHMNLPGQSALKIGRYFWVSGIYSSRP